MRRLIAFIALAAAVACASTGTPPGGPNDKAPPEVVSISPDSAAVNVNTKYVQFRFDKIVSDRPSGGKTDLNQLFLISPMDGSPNVRWRRDRIEVRPRKGFRANTAYTVTLLPGLSDLHGNVRREQAGVVFATGQRFPTLGLQGRVFDWASERPAPNAFVEALHLPDSVRYVAASDSSGSFIIGPFDAGTYLVRAVIDRNDNRSVDRGEPWDSVRVTLTDTRRVLEMLAIERDSNLAFNDVTSPDSVTLDLTFDKYLSPAQQIDPTNILVQRADSTPMIVTQVQSGAVIERLRVDSMRIADSLRAAAAPPGARPTPPSAAPSPLSLPPKPSRPPPSKKLRVKLSPTTPLVTGQTYRITTHNLDNLAGRAGDVTRTYSVPKPVPLDSLGRPLPTPPPTRPPTRPPPATERVMR